MPLEVFLAAGGERLLLVFLSLTLAFSLLVSLLNRVMNSLVDGVYKAPLVLAVFLAGLGAAGWWAWHEDASTATWILAMGYATALLCELQRQWIRWRSRGQSPVERQGRSFSLLRPLTTTDLQVIRYAVPLPGWSGRPFRLVHLSDLHFHEKIPLEYFQSVVERANQAQPDLILITGDFVTHLHALPQLPALLAGLNSRLGIFAILGNHDYWSDPEQVVQVVRQAGIHLLRTGWERVAIEPGHSLLLLGCEAPWSRQNCAYADLPQDGVRIALSHSADTIYALNRFGVKAVFSGHYHAGQFHLPGFGPLVLPSRLGRRFYQGHFIVNGTHLFVSSGVGCAEPALRLYCPPDFLIIDCLPDHPG